MPEIKVKIGSDVSGAVAGINQVGSALSRLAGLGSAAAITAAVIGVKKLFEAIDSGNPSVARHTKLIAEVGKEYVKAVSNVNQLKNDIDLAKQGFIDKDIVVKTFNETMGKTVGLVKNLEEAEKSLNKNADAYIQFTLKKAVANLALQKSAEKALEIELLLRKPPKPGGIFGLGVSLGDILNQIDKFKLNKLERAKTEFDKIAKSSEKAAAEIAKAFKFDFDQNLKAPKKLKIKPSKIGIDLGEQANDPVILPVKNLIIDAEGRTGIMGMGDKIKEALDGGDISNSPIRITNKELDELIEKAQETGNIVGNHLANAFDTLVDAMLRGENIAKAFFHTIIQGIIDVIKQLVRAAIVSAVTRFLLPGIGQAGSAVGSALPRRAHGGPVRGGMPYLIGEMGPELFIPGSSGTIVSNSNLSSIRGGAAQMVSVMVTGRLSGRDIILSGAREGRYQGRNV